ncbi:hypothetical protein [Cellulosimicrobium cellulans]|uniref:hypothetical protein n=1 Tax=Cellulosimicrobium cellulans TaxID=1710 RepID=UPI00130E2693|nr:hypothetical protein [Cellulosimicrobium cellulans]
MTSHAYVDESKARDYLLAATIVDVGSVHGARQEVRRLVLPRQSRVHMKHESDRRRRIILSALAELGLGTTIYSAGGPPARTQIARRRACLARLVTDLATGCDRLVLESDETQDARDRRDLLEITRAAGRREGLSYEHRRAGQEPLLALPDVVAWCWARGGERRRRAAPLTAAVVDV